jgi:hypothetical protein
MIYSLVSISSLVGDEWAAMEFTFQCVIFYEFMMFIHKLYSPLGNLQPTFWKRITYATRSSDTNLHTTRAEC